MIDKVWYYSEFKKYLTVIWDFALKHVTTSYVVSKKVNLKRLNYCSSLKMS